MISGHQLGHLQIIFTAGAVTSEKIIGEPFIGKKHIIY